MNRADLQVLAATRLREANILHRAGEYSGAYYLAGYSVECALKAVIAKRTQQFDFPYKQVVLESYSHDLLKLVSTARLQNELLRARKAKPNFDRNCNILFEWSERSRYSFAAEEHATDILESIHNSADGVLPWITRYW